MSGTLKDHLEEVDKSAEDMFALLVKQLSTIERVTEKRKETDQMAWIGATNNIRSAAEGIVLSEIIYR